LQTSRRAFLKTCAAVSVTPLVADAANISPNSSASIGAVIVEASSGEARRFGARLGEYGPPVYGINADVTPVWYKHLDRQWRARPFAVAGMTLRPALFCLEQLALAHGMRVVHHARHGRAGAGDSQRQWPIKLADRIQTVPLSLSPAARDRGFAGTPLLAGDSDSTLHSWVIAPVVRS